MADAPQWCSPRSSHPPGTFWYYNNWDFNALGTIFEKATGKDPWDLGRKDVDEFRTAIDPLAEHRRSGYVKAAAQERTARREALGKLRLAPLTVRD